MIQLNPKEALNSLCGDIDLFLPKLASAIKALRPQESCQIQLSISWTNLISARRKIAHGQMALN
jgi:hypothetical protein